MAKIIQFKYLHYFGICTNYKNKYKIIVQIYIYISVNIYIYIYVFISYISIYHLENKIIIVYKLYLYF